MRSFAPARPRRERSGGRVLGVGRALAVLGSLLATGGFVASVVFDLAAARGELGPWLFSAVFLLFAFVGSAVAYHRPGNAVGWLLLGMGVLECLLGGGLGSYGAWLRADDIGRGGLAIALADAADIIGPGSGALTLMLFPTGRLLPGRRWRIAVGVILTWMMLAFVSALRAELPASASADWTLPTDPLTAVSPFVLLLGALGIVARARSASDEVRHQLKWISLSAVLLVLGLGMVVVGWSTGLVESLGEPFFYVLFLASLFSVPITIGIAILRHHLFDIDRLISRTVSYTVVSAVLVGSYLGIVLALSAATRALGSSSDLAVAASTLTVAALFQPVRRRVQGWVDRRFNRRRYDAARTAEAFASTLRDEVQLGRLAKNLTAAVAATVAPSHSAVWLAPSVTGAPASSVTVPER